MSGPYVALAGYVTVQTAVPGGRAEVDIPRGATLPDDVPAEQIAALLRLGRIATAETPAVAAAAPAPGVVPSGPMARVLAWVGDDASRALAAAEAERAAEKPRTTLLAKLDEILAATNPDA